MIKALISDFGGVLMRTRADGSRRALEQRVGLPPNTIEARVFSSELSLSAQRGEISEEDFANNYFEYINIVINCTADGCLAKMATPFPTFDFPFPFPFPTPTTAP